MSILSTELAGEVAVVTGSAQGIGEAIARKFALHGARVALADIQFEKAQAVAAWIVAMGGTAQAFPVDISKPASLTVLRESVRAAFGSVSLLVNNAAVIPFQEFLSLTWDDWIVPSETTSTARSIARGYSSMICWRSGTGTSSSCLRLTASALKPA